MKFLSILLASVLTLTSCATRKYGCNYSQANTQPTYRSTGYVNVVDSDLCVIYLTGKVVVRDDFYFHKCNYVVVDSNLINRLKPFNNQLIKFEFSKNSEMFEDVIWASSICVEETNNQNEGLSSIGK